MKYDLGNWKSDWGLLDFFKEKVILDLLWKIYAIEGWEKKRSIEKR